MHLKDRTVLLLGGAGLVGRAVARAVLQSSPHRVVLSSLRRPEVEEAVEELRPYAGATELVPVWGDLFVPNEDRELSRAEVLSDAGRRSRMVSDIYGELSSVVFERSALGSLLLETRPDIVVDCINTAGALAYQDAFASAAELREAAEAGQVTSELVERHLSTLYLPKLIRHTQIALEGMRRAGTRMYVKVGTAGTGGMGLNIPFTHSEERPSRMLLAKAGLAGAQSLLLYLMARTPDAPAVKEIKPTAAISWKSIGFGPIRRAGEIIRRVDCTRPLELRAAFRNEIPDAMVATDVPLQGVFLDAGENGLFSLPEFEVLTALGLMEYVTPEEIAQNVVREIQAHPTGKDVVAALDAATMGPTYRAGVLRAAAIQRMAELEVEHGVEAVAYEMLGPPRLSKLLFEGAILSRLFRGMEDAAGLDPNETGDRAAAAIQDDTDLRQRILSIGLPILLPDGAHLLRGPRVAVAPDNPDTPIDPRLVERGWVDLRASNWARWKERIIGMRTDFARIPGVESGSIGDHDVAVDPDRLRPGQMAAWIMRSEERGARIKR